MEGIIPNIPFKGPFDGPEVVETEYKFKINITPHWDFKPNMVLNATYYATSGYSYSAKISGPGIKKEESISFEGNDIQFKKIEIPKSIYSSGKTLQYEVVITTNSNILKGQVQNSIELGRKEDGSAITYQGILFTNDAGSDHDWNDCVVNLALYNDSTD